jgi:hypothetical protein
MNAENFNIEWVLKMAHSPLHNYIIPGLTSSLIGMPSDKGTMRVFQNERDHQETIAPHSHRFDFQCWVLRGSVRNRVWTKTYGTNVDSDLYQRTCLQYHGSVGSYTTHLGTIDKWMYHDYVYDTGQCYSMKAEYIHSIFFSRGAVVLFFEGPTKFNSSTILEPVVNGERIPTFEVKPWMFDKGELK